MCLPRVVVPPPHSTLTTGRCNRHEAVWREYLKLSPSHLKALKAMPIDWISLPECNLPFDSATKYQFSARSDWRAQPLSGTISRSAPSRSPLRRPLTASGAPSSPSQRKVPTKCVDASMCAGRTNTSSTSTSRWRACTPFSSSSEGTTSLQRSLSRTST